MSSFSGSHPPGCIGPTTGVTCPFLCPHLCHERWSSARGQDSPSQGVTPNRWPRVRGGERPPGGSTAPRPQTGMQRGVRVALVSSARRTAKGVSFQADTCLRLHPPCLPRHLRAPFLVRETFYSPSPELSLASSVPGGEWVCPAEGGDGSRETGRSSRFPGCPSRWSWTAQQTRPPLGAALTILFSVWTVPWSALSLSRFVPGEVGWRLWPCSLRPERREAGRSGCPEAGSSAVTKPVCFF